MWLTMKFFTANNIPIYYKEQNMKKFKCVQADKIIFGAHEELSRLAKNEFALAYGSFRFVEELALL